MKIKLIILFFYFSPVALIAQEEGEPDDFTYDKLTHALKFSDTLFYVSDSTQIPKQLNKYLQGHYFKRDKQNSKKFYKTTIFYVHQKKNGDKKGNVMGKVEYLLSIEIIKRNVIITYSDFFFKENQSTGRGKPLDRTFPNKMEIIANHEKTKAYFIKLLDDE